MDILVLLDVGVLGAGILQDGELKEGLGHTLRHHGLGRGYRGRYHRIEALRQLVVQLHPVHLRDG